MGEDGKHKHTLATPGRKIVMTRVFDAPRELVFDAHSSCELVGPAEPRGRELRDRLPPRRCLEDHAPSPRARDHGVLRRVPRDRPP